MSDQQHISEEIPSVIRNLRSLAGADRATSREMGFLAEVVLEAVHDDEEEPVSEAPISLRKGTQ